MAVTTRAGRPVPPTTVVPRPARPMPWVLRFYRSAVGKKWVMGITGFLLVGYVVAHALGNAKMYLGAASINEYGEALRDLGGHLVPRTNLLWLMRIGLFAAFAFHIHAAYGLTRMNWKANTSKYAGGQDWQAVNFAGRTMRWTGVIVALFVVFHLADLTWGWTTSEFVRGDVYHNLDVSLSRWWVSAIYMIGIVALSIHLFHGVFSAFQSLGVTNPHLSALRRPLSILVAAFVLVLNMSFPIAVLAGVVGEGGS